MACKKGQGSKVENYKKAFKAADASGDGFLDKKEFEAMLRKSGCNLPAQEFDKVFGFFDQDKDKNKISFNEFCDGLNLLEETMHELQELFNHADADKSGRLDKAELKKLMEASGMKFTEAELNDALKKADKNGDNQICFEEFLDAIC